jgi:hypothetical protein
MTVLIKVIEDPDPNHPREACSLSSFAPETKVVVTGTIQATLVVLGF